MAKISNVFSKKSKRLLIQKELQSGFIIQNLQEMKSSIVTQRT